MDSELIEQLQLARQGDVQGFSYVATAFRVQVLSWAREVVKSEHTAEDAAQEALITAFQKLETLRELEAFPGWLRTLTRTAALRQVRRRRPDLIGEPEADAPESEEAVDSETRTLVRAAITELSDVQQAVIERHYFRGEKLGEIANALGLPLGTVKRRLHDAREKMRIKLAGFGPTRSEDEWRG